MSTVDLLPCPFCGGEAKHSPKIRSYAETVSCGCCVDFYGSPEEWNTRAPRRASPASLAPQGEAQPVEDDDNPAKIWLDPVCGWDAPEGRMWHGSRPDRCDDCDLEPVEYIRADLAHPSPAPEAWRTSSIRQVAIRAIPAPVGADHRSFPDAADGRPMPPMGDELMIAGLNGDDARFVAIQLAQNGLMLVPDPAVSAVDVSETASGKHQSDLASAEAPQATVSAVTVKPLVWRSAGYHGQCQIASAFGLDVFAEIDGQPGDWTLTIPGATSYEHRRGFKTREDARVAAQADYEARVRAAIAKEG